MEHSGYDYHHADGSHAFSTFPFYEICLVFYHLYFCRSDGCIRWMDCQKIRYQTLPQEIWFAVSGIVLVRLAAYITAAIKYHRFASLHTWLNKLTGVAVFLLPYVILKSPIVVYSWTVCILAFLSSAEELAIHLTKAEYLADRKSIIEK